jgi:hypothetical protein
MNGIYLAKNGDSITKSMDWFKGKYLQETLAITRQLQRCPMGFLIQIWDFSGLPGFLRTQEPKGTKIAKIVRIPQIDGTQKQ